MFRLMLANPREDITLRGVACTLNMLSADREVAEKIVETDITEILMALTKLPPGEFERRQQRGIAAGSGGWSVVLYCGLAAFEVVRIFSQ